MALRLLTMAHTPPAQSAEEPTPKFLSVKQAAVELGVSIWTVYELCGNGSLKATKVKSRIKIRPEWIDEYIDSLPSYAPESA